MLSLFSNYDHWARAARGLDLNEWPDPGTKDIWTGAGGEQYGVWSEYEKSGVLASFPTEFDEWLAEGDLPENYVEIEVSDGGATHNFVASRR